MIGGMLCLRKLHLKHLLQKYDPEINCYLWDFEWGDVLEREHYGPVMMENGPVMSVPVVNYGPGKCCCQWYFTSRLTLASVTALGYSQLVCCNTKVC